LDRPHARRRRHGRGGDRPAVHRAWPGAAQPQHARARSAAARGGGDGDARGTGGAGAEQFLRLRRQQLQPAVRGAAMIAPLYLRAVGLAAPGLPGWSAGRAVLAGAQPWAEQEEAPYAPQLLPPNERRRAPPGVRQAFRAGEDARAGCTLDFSALAAVFASSDSDLTVMDRINTALAEPVRAVSPTDFHNS